MDDVTPELLKRIKDDFQSRFDKNTIISELYEKVRKGTATYKEANDFAVETGNILATTYKDCLSSQTLPDGKMYYNIAQGIINTTLKKDYDLVTDITSQIQQKLNKEAGLGIKAIIPEFNQDRANGIINRVSNSESYDDVAWILNEPVKVFSQSIVDDAVKINAEFHAQAGLIPKIIRKSTGRCCAWCNALAGTYIYPDVPQEIWRRHQRCRCTVDYIPEKSKKAQNVWSKEWEDIEKRKKVGIKESSNFILKKGTDVTAEYEHRKFPGQGKINYDERYDVRSHPEEIAVAEWLHETLGGDIKLLAESDTDGVKMPDYIWNNKYWELKSTTTEKAANSAIRKGIKQIAGNPGGIILDYKNDIDIQEVINVIEKRVSSSKEGNLSFDIIIVAKKKINAVIRY